MKPRIAVFYGVMFVMVWGSMEIVGLLSCKLLTGEYFSYTTLHQEQRKRIAALQKSLSPDHESRSLYDFHPYLGYIGHPGARPWGEDHPQFNDYGMLSVSRAPYPSRRQNDQLIVAIVGGSVAEVFANTTEDHLNDYLRETLHFKKQVKFINLATGGYKEPQQLFHLVYAVLLGFEFDVVLNIDGFNDLVLAHHNIDQRFHPLFPSAYHLGFLSQAQLNARLDYQAVKLLDRYYSLHETELSLLSLMQHVPFKYSVFLNIAADLWTKHNMKRIEWAEYNLLNETPETASPVFRGPPFHATGSPAETYMLMARIWRQASEMLYGLCRQQHIAYIHVLQPNQYVDGSKPLTEHEKRTAIDPRNPWGRTAREGYPYLTKQGEELKKEGVPFYDFTMLFKETARDIYTDSCCHFGDEGNTMMAEEIAKILTAEFQRQSF